MALKLTSANLSVTEFKKISIRDLQKKFHLEKASIFYLKTLLRRKPIDAKILSKLLLKSNFTCCVCKGTKSDAYIIHHINEYSNSEDNRYSNLAVLCPNDHDLAHRTGNTITRNLTPRLIRESKKLWEKKVIEMNSKAARVPKTKEQWNSLATKLANYIQSKLFPAHRGAIMYAQSTTIVFGNDGYVSKNNKRAYYEVMKLRSLLKLMKWIELGFGLSKDEYTWCMLLKSENVDFLNNAIWECYPAGPSTSEIQRKVAQITLSPYRNEPLSDYFS